MIVDSNEEKEKIDLRDAINKIASDDGRYASEAFCMVALGYLTLMRNKTLSFNSEKKKREFKLDYSELITYLKLLGWESFGPLAKIVFNHWNLKSGKDFIEIIDCMVETKMLDKETLKKNAPDCYPLKDFSFDFYDQSGLMMTLG